MATDVTSVDFGAIVVARLSSSRLPGKVLMEAGDGRRLIDFTFETLRNVPGLSRLIMATSDAPSDDPLCDYCDSVGVECFRGSLENVAARFGAAMERLGVSAAFRVNGDSPLISRQLFERAMECYRLGELDLVTNIFPRTFPPGVSVELIRTSTFQSLLSRITTAAEQEHVTRYFYQNADEFRIHNLQAAADYSNVHLAVDTPEQFSVFRCMVRQMNRPHWTYTVSDLCELYVDCEHSLYG